MVEPKKRVYPKRKKRLPCGDSIPTASTEDLYEEGYRRDPFEEFDPERFTTVHLRSRKYTDD